VMVWFHGGGWAVGSGALPIFDGEALARRGVLIVTVNYRLGPLGFFAHPELSAESQAGACGNYSLLDQIAALRWLRQYCSLWRRSSVRHRFRPVCRLCDGQCFDGLAPCA